MFQSFNRTVYTSVFNSKQEWVIGWTNISVFDHLGSFRTDKLNLNLCPGDRPSIYALSPPNIKAMNSNSGGSAQTNTASSLGNTSSGSWNPVNISGSPATNSAEFLARRESFKSWNTNDIFSGSPGGSNANGLINASSFNGEDQEVYNANVDNNEKNFSLQVEFLPSPPKGLPITYTFPSLLLSGDDSDADNQDDTEENGMWPQLRA